MNNDRFIIEILDKNNWQIEDKETGEFVNPVDGTTNVLKGLVKSINKFYNESEELKTKNQYLLKVMFAIKNYIEMGDYEKVNQAVDKVKEKILNE